MRYVPGVAGTRLSVDVVLLAFVVTHVQFPPFVDFHSIELVSFPLAGVTVVPSPPSKKPVFVPSAGVPTAKRMVNECERDPPIIMLKGVVHWRNPLLSVLPARFVVDSRIKPYSVLAVVVVMAVVPLPVL